MVIKINTEPRTDKEIDEDAYYESPEGELTNIMCPECDSFCVYYLYFVDRKSYICRNCGYEWEN